MVLIKFLVIRIKWMECAFYCFCSALLCSVLFNSTSSCCSSSALFPAVPYFLPDCFLFDFVVCTLMPRAITRFLPHAYLYTRSHTNKQTKRKRERHAHSIYIMEWFLKFRKHIRCVMWRIFGPLFIYLFRLFSLSFVGIVCVCLVEAFWLTFPLVGIHFQWCSVMCVRDSHTNREHYNM